MWSGMWGGSGMWSGLHGRRAAGGAVCAGGAHLLRQSVPEEEAATLGGVAMRVDVKTQLTAGV